MQKILLLCLTLLSTSVHAITECAPTKTERIYVGDDGVLWIVYTNGGSAYVTETDPDFKNIYSLVLAAHLAQKPIIVRYSSANAPCDGASRNDIQGIWLSN